MLIGLVQLRSVDLSSNRLTSIDNGALEALPSLEQVNLRANRLVAIGPDAFKVRFLFNQTPNCMTTRRTFKLISSVAAHDSGRARV